VENERRKGNLAEPLLKAGTETGATSSVPKVDAALLKEALYAEGRDDRHIGAGCDITQEVGAGGDPTGNDKDGREGIKASESRPNGIKRQGDRGDDCGVSGRKRGRDGVCPEEGEAVKVLMEEHGRPISPDNEFQDVDDDPGKGDGDKDEERLSRPGVFPGPEPEKHEEE
jgi:hypothetical protein